MCSLCHVESVLANILESIDVHVRGGKNLIGNICIHTHTH